MRTIRTDDDGTVRLGTRQDDARYKSNVLFIQTEPGLLSRRVLTREQALHLVSALLDTIDEMGIDPIAGVRASITRPQTP